MAVSIALILLLGLLADHFFTKMKIPGLLGMLLVGIVCGPYVLDILQPELLRVSADLRMVALVVILLRAGLKLRRDTLNRVGKSAIFMGMGPSLAEGGVVALLAPFFFEVSWLEAALLGSAVAAVSPAVVVPSMLGFMEREVGAKKGVPTLILSGASVDNVFVIVIFSILLGLFTGGEGAPLMKLLEIPESIFAGMALGTAVGLLLHMLFKHFHLRATKMTITVVAVSVLFTWLEGLVKPWLALSALMGVMTVGFVLLEKAEAKAHLISNKLSKVWIFAEILLFVLVGAQVNIHVIWQAGLLGAGLIFLGLVGRSIGVWFSLLGSHLNTRERQFCVLAYVPKATVQAAIGAVPLEMGVASGDIILAVAVLSIILTAPLGAMAIHLTGDRWLQEQEQVQT
ncbi:MAG: cation:proton antiporter [Magnetococcales bacterium]|nr:cation:proton antiporter [Magnetococcales bacterium]